MQLHLSKTHNDIPKGNFAVSVVKNITTLQHTEQYYYETF